MRQSVKRMIDSEETIWMHSYYSWSFACAVTGCILLFVPGLALLLLAMPQMPRNPWETCMDAEPEQMEWPCPLTDAPRRKGTEKPLWLWWSQLFALLTEKEQSKLWKWDILKSPPRKALWTVVVSWFIILVIIKCHPIFSQIKLSIHRKQWLIYVFVYLFFLWTYLWHLTLYPRQNSCSLCKYFCNILIGKIIFNYTTLYVVQRHPNS